MQVDGNGGPCLGWCRGAQPLYVSGSSSYLLVGSQQTGQLAAWAVAASLGPRVIVREETVGGLEWACPGLGALRRP